MQPEVSALVKRIALTDLISGKAKTSFITQLMLEQRISDSLIAALADYGLGYWFNIPSGRHMLYTEPACKIFDHLKSDTSLTLHVVSYQNGALTELNINPHDEQLHQSSYARISTCHAILASDLQNGIGERLLRGNTFGVKIGNSVVREIRIMSDNSLDAVLYGWKKIKRIDL